MLGVLCLVELVRQSSRELRLRCACSGLLDMAAFRVSSPFLAALPIFRTPL